MASAGKVMIQSGYFDGATNYFDAKYTMWQLDSSGAMKDRLRFKPYRSGHMMYLRLADLTRGRKRRYPGVYRLVDADRRGTG